ncbi:hypothetical protein QJQ45_010038 [Haematococcus lacustris]|nr:hypothetical protein QJQ45_010038 [Haematococcus lacustris]
MQRHEVNYLVCPVSNALVETLLQLLKHGTGVFMELPAQLELMSMRTHSDAIIGVDMLDFAQRLPELLMEVRREKAAATSASWIAKAEMKAAAATHVQLLAAAKAPIQAGKSMVTLAPWKCLNVTNDMMDAAVSCSMKEQPPLYFRAVDQFYNMQELEEQVSVRAAKYGGGARV